MCNAGVTDFCPVVAGGTVQKFLSERRYVDFTVPIEKRVAPRKGGATSMGFAAEGLAPGQRFPGDTQGEATQRAKKQKK